MRRLRNELQMETAHVRHPNMVRPCPRSSDARKISFRSSLISALILVVRT